MPVRMQRHRSTAPLAALLLVLQGIGGGAVALVHASEQFNAPIHIEAQHQSSCLPLHNELRCALCHYVGMRVLPQLVRARPDATTRSDRRPGPSDLARASGPDHLTAPARAPPTPLA